MLLSPTRARSRSASTQTEAETQANGVAASAAPEKIAVPQQAPHRQSTLNPSNIRALSPHPTAPRSGRQTLPSNHTMPRAASPSPKPSARPFSLKDLPMSMLSMAFGEEWSARKMRIRATSKHAQDLDALYHRHINELLKLHHLPPLPPSSLPPCPTWDIVSVIHKAGDDLRQELLASQLLGYMSRLFRQANLPIYVRPYSVVLTSPTSGLIETIPNAVSVDSLKKNVSALHHAQRLLHRILQ